MRKVLIIACLLLSLQAMAQKQPVTEEDYRNTRVEMADAFREDGKIYVVVAIVAAILLGLLVYTVRIDNKISGIEKELKEGE